LWPAAGTADALHAVAHDAHRSCGGRLTRRETLHLTLAFLGDIPAARLPDAEAAAVSVGGAPFELLLDRLGCWKHILWAGGDSPPLAALAEGLAARLRRAGFRLEERPFAAHVTLLRDARCPAVPAMAETIVWRVTEFVLAESRSDAAGARYEIIGRWPLVGAVD
jgi:2'-5' RNA ligase